MPKGSVVRFAARPARGRRVRAVLLALREGVLPPTANFTAPDPLCDLDVVPNQARRAEVECALSSSFAFGGLNAVLAFRRWEG
jgi:nodulation protein E